MVINMNNSGKTAEPEKAVLSDNEVTSHTASMWKYVPVAEFPEPYPEYRTSCEKLSGISVTAARVRGKKHKHEGTNCDDWYEYSAVDDWMIAVVSDGAGSKLLSRIGAKVSCEAAVKSLKKEIIAVKEMCPDAEETLAKPYGDKAFVELCTKLAVVMQNGISDAYSAVESAYLLRNGNTEIENILGRKAEIKDYSGTLLCAVIIPVNVNGNNESFVISLQIGDGIIATVNLDAPFEKALRILGNADTGSFSGETEFLTSELMRNSDNLKSRTKIQRCPINALMLMTDGVADDYYPSNPQILRLYIDLILNGAVEMPKYSDKTDKVTAVPEPVAYPWVNDGYVKYSIQYARNILEKTGISLSELWNSRDIIAKASLMGFNISNGDNCGESLSVWLDNYVERGSFDDRTLVVINTNK